MLIDWITARLDEEHLRPEQLQKLRKMGDRIVRYSAETGAVTYETNAWDSIRSDSHSLTIRMGSDCLWINGSPARVIGDGCAVFGSGASAALDLSGCIDSMRSFVSHQTDIILPYPDYWKVSRIDVTNNILLDSFEEVKQALNILRDCEGGRYRVSNIAGDSTYWGGKSKRKKAKAYSKGAHLEYLMRLKKYDGKRYTPDQIEKAKRLLRLELTLGSKFMSENSWKEMDGNALEALHNDYFNRMIGDKDMTNENELFEKLQQVAPTEGQAKAAYSCFLFIGSHGWRKAYDYYPKSTYYRNIKNLRLAGLGDADISKGEIVPLRRKIIDFQPVNNWSDLMAA